MGIVSGGRRRAFRSRHHTPMGQGGKLAVIFGCTALLLFVFAVMLGNYLRGLAENIIDETTPEITTEAEIYYATAPSKVIAEGVFFEIPDQLPTATEEDTNADETYIPEDPIRFDSVSMSLRHRDEESGEMLLAYSSDISLEYAIDVTADISLSDGVTAIRDFYGEAKSICGVFEIDHSLREGQSREIMRAYELALICELIDAGIDEIVLIGFENNIEEGVSFISDIYEQKGRGTAIGLALSFDYLVSQTASEELFEITKKCAFLALDLHSLTVPSLMSAEDLISDRVSRSLAICREYSIRVILGCGDAPDGESQTRAAMNAGANNLMTVLGIKKQIIEDVTTAE